MNNINNYKSNLKFITYEYSKNEINFLDLKVEFKEGSLVTNVYIKPRNRHQYLHHHSSCLDHIKRSITYIQALRVNRLCSGKKIFLITPAKWNCDLKNEVTLKNNMINRKIAGVTFPENMLESLGKILHINPLSNKK